MKLLADKVVFLTGGSSGIGLECAKAYVQHGAYVAIVSNNAADNRAAMDILGPEHYAVHCDVAMASDVKNAVEKVCQYYGRIDAIHNNAGTAFPSKALHHTTSTEWENLFNINLKSILHTTQFGLDLLKKTRGCILNTSSLVGEIGQELHAAYAATKGGINALTKSMALDYAAYRVRVNAVSPAGVWTPMLRRWQLEQPDQNGIEEYLDNIHALGYCPEGDVIADACVFLLSEQARFITGCILPVSGGAELGYRRSMKSLNVTKQVKQPA